MEEATWVSDKWHVNNRRDYKIYMGPYITCFGAGIFLHLVAEDTEEVFGHHQSQNDGREQELMKVELRQLHLLQQGLIKYQENDM